MRKADGKLKAPWAGAAGVNVEDAAVLFDRWFVGVAAHDYVKAGAGSADVDLFDIVKHVD